MRNKFLLRKILIVFLLLFSLFEIVKPVTVQAAHRNPPTNYHARA